MLNRGTLKSRRSIVEGGHHGFIMHYGRIDQRAASAYRESLSYRRIAEELDDAIAKSSGSEREHLELARKKAEHFLVAGYRLASSEIGYALYPVESPPSKDPESAREA